MSTLLANDPRQGERPPVAIVVVTHDSARHVERLVRSLAQLDYPRDRRRLLVVDNASSDDGPARLQSAAAACEIPVEVIRNSGNLGFGRAVNRGVRASGADLVLLLNPDLEIERVCLGELVAAMNARPDAGLVEARQRPVEHPKLYDPVTLETPWSSAAACLLRRAAFEAVGGFDEALFLYCEDVDLSWRMRAAGYRCYYAPRALVHHDSHAGPGVENPLLSYYGTRHNLFLRWRYGSLLTILGGYVRLLGLLASQWRDATRFRRFGRILFSHVPSIPAALRGRWRLRRARVGAFQEWDYGPSRRAWREPESRPSSLPLVSIVVRTHAPCVFLRETLTSLANQAYPALEAIVAEDGTSAAEAVAAEFAGRLRVRYVRAPAGAGRSRTGNLGMREAAGELAGFLDDDDVLFGDHVEALVSAIARERTRVAYGLAFEASQQILAEDPLRYRITGRELVWDQAFDRLRLLHHNYLPIQCVLFEKRLYEQAGGLDESLDCLEDWELWLRFALSGERFAFVPKVTSEYRRRRSTPEERALDDTRQHALDRTYLRVLDKHGSAEVRLTLADLHATVTWIEDLARWPRAWKKLRRRGIAWALRRILGATNR